MERSIWFFLALHLTGQVMMAQETTQDIRLISDRLTAGWIAHRFSPDRVEDLLAGLEGDGGWKDIDYTDVSRTHWQPAGHPSRLAQLAEAYAVEKAPRVKEAVLNGLRFWATRDPESDNWWWNCISSPRDLARTVLLMGDAVPADLVRALDPLVHRSGFSRTGANLTNEASNLLVWACATHNEDLMRASIAHLTGEIRVAIGEEGIQVDNSFHQHGPQLQMSSYAEVFMRDATEHALLFEGTAYALNPEQIVALSQFVREGQQWFTWGHRVDFHGMGRGAGRTGGTGGAGGMRLIAERMAQIDPAHREEYEHFAARTKDALAPGVYAPKGNRHYYRSDVMVHRPGHFHTSVRMHSTRTYGCEVRVNQENLKGYHVSDGAYFVMQSGDEYLEIQPVWDWRKLPGVTYRETAEPYPYGSKVPQAGQTDFVGGVSDGQTGMAAMDWVKDDVTARKSYFFFDSGFVCLGAGISAQKPEAVLTSVNQCLRQGEILLLKEVPKSMDQGLKRVQNLRGVFHAGIGTYFLADQQVVVRADIQEGSWKDLEANSRQSETLKKEVFSVWIDHGTTPRASTYAYAVMPGMDRETFVAHSEDLPFQVLANRVDVQAVAFPNSRTVHMAFYEAGAFQTPDGTRIQVDVPCLVILQDQEALRTLSIADPTQKVLTAHITLSESYLEKERGAGGHDREWVVDFPQGEGAGRTVVRSISK